MLPDALADGHLPQLSQGLNLIATGLDVSAGLVEGMKVGAVVQLGILAGEIIADQAAAPFTFGASEPAIPGEVEITSQIVKAAFKAVAQQVEQALLNAIEGPIFSARATRATTSPSSRRRRAGHQQRRERRRGLLRR